MGRATPATPAADPLADLRGQEGPVLPGGSSVPVIGPPTEAEASGEAEDQEVVEVRPMVTQEVWDEMVTEAVVAFHRDPTSQGFLHGGGQCGCRYIAKVALGASVPVVTEQELEAQELEPSGD